MKQLLTPKEKTTNDFEFALLCQDKISGEVRQVVITSDDLKKFLNHTIQSFTAYQNVLQGIEIIDNTTFKNKSK